MIRLLFSRALRLVLAPLAVLFASSLPASATDCAGATGAVCYCLVDGTYKMYFAAGVAAGSVPASVTFTHTPPGGTPQSATCAGLSATSQTASGSATIPPGSTNVSISVSGANCGPTNIPLIPGQNYGSCTPCPYRPN